MDLARMRHEYESKGLDIGDVDPDPMAQFDRWLNEAVSAGVVEPNAMVVSSVDADSRPHSRHLLLKGISQGGFEFYTNYTSSKASQLDASGSAALTFGWLALHRQVNIVGTAKRLTEAESDAYFDVRPRGSQLGAWASDQSAPIAGREVLEENLAELESRFPDVVTRPPDWGGYRVTPLEIEFWQGRPSRLHDRLRYRRSEASDLAAWSIARLAP